MQFPQNSRHTDFPAPLPHCRCCQRLRFNFCSVANARELQVPTAIARYIYSYIYITWRAEQRKRERLLRIKSKRKTRITLISTSEGGYLLDMRTKKKKLEREANPLTVCFIMPRCTRLISFAATARQDVFLRYKYFSMTSKRRNSYHRLYI